MPAGLECSFQRPVDPETLGKLPQDFYEDKSNSSFIINSVTQALRGLKVETEGPIGKAIDPKFDQPEVKCINTKVIIEAWKEPSGVRSIAICQASKCLFAKGEKLSK